jgi:hypothetical protein
MIGAYLARFSTPMARARSHRRHPVRMVLDQRRWRPGARAGRCGGHCADASDGRACRHRSRQRHHRRTGAGSLRRRPSCHDQWPQIDLVAGVYSRGCGLAGHRVGACGVITAVTDLARYRIACDRCAGLRVTGRRSAGVMHWHHVRTTAAIAAASGFAGTVGGRA